MFTGLLVACLYSQTIKDAAAYYCTMAVSCVCLAVLSATTVRKHPRLALWLWYVLYAFFGADTDKLTYLLNKAAIERSIREKLLKPGAQGTLVILDIDNFKQINDTFGHAFGDVVLRLVAECILEESSALCGRFGGDEFLLFLPETGDALNREKPLDCLYERRERGINAL